MSSRNAPPHTRLLRTELHSSPHIIQSDFSFHFQEGRTTFTLRWLLHHSFALIGSMGEWQNNKNCQNKQSTSSVVAFESYSKFTVYEISSSSSSKQVEKMWSWLVEGTGQSPLLVSCSFAFKVWTLRLRAHISPESLVPDQLLHRISVKLRLKVSPV